jgi:spermidine/putrescine transport system substrate-binding protein
MVLLLGLGAGSGFVRSDELVVLNWADYMDPAVVSEFEHESGAKVRFIYFESDEDRDNFLMEHGIDGVDVRAIARACKSMAYNSWSGLDIVRSLLI